MVLRNIKNIKQNNLEMPPIIHCIQFFLFIISGYFINGDGGSYSPLINENNTISKCFSFSNNDII